VHPADLYGETRRRVVALARDIDPDQPVPACPEWTAHDVIAHLVGLAEDVVEGRMAGYSGAEWTQAQVDRRREASMDEMLDAWDWLAPTLVEINRDLAGSDLPDTIEHAIGPLPVTSFVAAFHVDLLHHEPDLLGALGRPRTDPLVADVEVLRAQLANVRARFAADEMATLRLSPTDADRSFDIGRDEPRAEVGASTVDLLRAVGGRRTLDEIRAFVWTGDYQGMPERLVLPFFSAPDHPLAGERPADPLLPG